MIDALDMGVYTCRIASELQRLASEQASKEVKSMQIEQVFNRDDVSVAESFRARLAYEVSTARKYVEVECSDELLMRARTAILDFAEDALYYAECLERSIAQASSIAMKVRQVRLRVHGKLPVGTVIRRWETNEDGELEEVDSLEAAAAIAGKRPEAYMQHEQELIESVERDELEEMLTNADIDPIKIRLDASLAQRPGLLIRKDEQQ